MSRFFLQNFGNSATGGPRYRPFHSGLPNPIQGTSMRPTISSLTSPPGSHGNGLTNFNFGSNTISNSVMGSSGQQYEQAVDSEASSIFRPYAQQGQAGSSYTLQSQAAPLDTPFTAKVNAIRNQGREVLTPKRRRSHTLSVPVVKVKTLQACFLGGKDEDYRPTHDRRNELGIFGLGDATITYGENANFEELYAAVMESFRLHIYPMVRIKREALSLDDIQFGIFYSKGQGNSRKSQLIPFRPSYTAADIKTLGVNCLYIKPSLDIFPEETDESGASMCSDDESNDHGANHASSEVTDQAEGMSVVPSSSESLEQYTVQEGTAGGFAWPSASTFADATSFQEFKRLIRVAYPERQNISVPRLEAITNEEIFRFDSEINPYNVTSINIEGAEQTVDLGGPLRSYISKIMDSIVKEPVRGVAALVGQNGHLTVTDDLSLIRTGFWSCFAKFLAFAAMNTGTGFYGLSGPLIGYILSQTGKYDGMISIADVCIVPVKVAALELEKCINDASYEMPPEHMENLQVWMQIFHDHRTFERERAQDALNVLKEHSVIEHRKSTLEALRVSFQTTPFGNWMSQHPHEANHIFVGFKETPLEEFMGSFVSTDDNVVPLSHMYTFMIEFVQGGGKVSKIVKLLTGFPQLTEETKKLHLTVDLELADLNVFKCSTCACTLRVFPVTDYAQFEQKINELIAKGESFHDF